MESNSESSPGAGNRIQTGERGICMSAALSYPVSALKSSARSRAQILILEPDLAVLDYLRSTLGSRHSLNLFSEEQALLDRLEKAEQPDLLLLALHTSRDPLPLLTHIRCTKPHLPVIVLSCSAELRDLEMVIRLGVRGIVMKPFTGRDRKSTRLNSSHRSLSRMPSSA